MKAPRNLSTTKARLIACALACLASLIALAAPPALANHVSCGQTITEDTTLDSDLTCTGDGIVIGADNITLDLGGHTITGDGDVFDFGVDNTAGYDGVEVTNGTIENFEMGIHLDGAEGNLLHKLVLSKNFGGIFLALSNGNTVEKNAVSGNDVGIFLGTANGNTVEKNAVSGNDSGIGVAFGANGNTVEKNAVAGNDVGIEVVFRARDNRFQQNEVSGNATDGIALSTPGNLLLKNTTNDNGDDGIDARVPETTITKNTANNNGDFGIQAVPGVIDGGGNEASRNGNPAQCSPSVDCS